MNDVVTRITYTSLVQCLQYLKEEVNYSYYRNGKGNPPSPKRILQGYGFKIRRKDKLIKAVEQYLSSVEVI
jgi:hypothetical protein|tara:strand:+ start:270 stop:482 length:213 start_codon:yes stop_codon:yes gene_type:complete